MGGEFLTARDIQKILGVKKAKSYDIIRTLNAQMKKEGYMVIRGKVSKAKFEECYCYKGPKSQTG
ncbi:ICEBs1 excisionase [Bacillus sonorensis]|uniref:ICEBs1 excisionase n=1 Tax=Bacillus sonorensis TaxID=119858 RepID=UPI000E4D193E|nr:ICEBs1 excisionase [Bacillus sonorensis]RHJ07001.1 ICEBs1 excisionase [Bacillus sonorensis]WPP37276.1 ICEBs1 excisionase [Bacillus sonorensis]